MLPTTELGPIISTYVPLQSFRWVGNNKKAIERCRLANRCRLAFFHAVSKVELIGRLSPKPPLDTRLLQTASFVFCSNRSILEGACFVVKSRNLATMVGSRKLFRSEEVLTYSYTDIFI